MEKIKLTLFHRHLCLFILICAGCSGLRAQTDSVTVSSGARFAVGLDSRSTIIEGRHININGAFVGISFGPKRQKFTLGYYWLGYNSAHRLIDFHKKISKSINLSYYTTTDVEFVSLAYWYPIILTRKWRFSLPIEAGLGRESANYRKLTNDNSVGNRNFQFAPIQIGTYAEYKITPWFGASTQLGYRNAFSNGVIRKRFAGMYYSYGLSLYPGTIYKDIRIWRETRKGKG